MNWDEVNTNMQRDGYTIQEVLSHWKKLGKFRNDHPSVGAGRHLKISDAPYTFSRSWTQDDFTDKVVIALDLETEEKTIDVGDNFANGEILTEAYSDQEVKVEEGKVRLSTPFDIVLLSK